MESTGASSGSTITAAAMPSPSVVPDNCKGTNFEFDPSLSEEEKRFYIKAYPTVDVVRERRTHCTVCKVHIGTAPVQEHGIKMHPILRVTHCNKCHDFYNSGEFSKGEDGSELYCRWCGQGGEVYCCSSCPYVFCKSCIVKNLSKGVVADIEQNENWNCFKCAPKILWPLRAQHWALMNYIEQQKKGIYELNLSESELKMNLSKDRSKCCRLAKAKCGNMSDSMESLDSVASKRSHSSSFSAKKPVKHSATPSPQHMNAAKRAKNNDEVVCTPDLLSMLEPDCQITVTPKPNRPMGTPSASTPKIMSIQQPQPSYGSMHSTPKNSAPPPLVLRNTAIKIRPAVAPPVVRRTIIGPRTPNPGGNGTPVYHTINGYRIDLNSAAQQETFRLPNGKLIQVKRQGPPPPQNTSSSVNNWQQLTSPQPQRVIPQTIASRPVQITPHPYNISVQQQQQPQGQHPQVVRYHNNIIGTTTTINPVPHNGTTIQVLNGQVHSVPQLQPQQQQTVQQSGPIRPIMLRHVFTDTPIGHARSGLQDQVFNAMDICTHLTNKVQTLTNSNAYKQARNFLEVKELYIHLSYLLTYAIGRFKSLQDKCLGDMRTLGFGNDADCLENGQLAAAVDYVCYGQLDDVDLFNTGSNSFHNQVYEYRKSLHANLKDGEDGAKSPLPPIFSLSQSKSEDADDDVDGEDSLLEEPKGLKGHWLEGGDDSPIPSNYNQENEEPDDSYLDDDDDGYNRSSARGSYNDGLMQGTEESMKKNEENYAYDRKLTRLVSQYPSIWCTRHPDYGNFEVTRKQWHTIASHFGGKEHIKLRWKNIRKRFVRIEKRIAEGKRFNGHFDKAMAFLANRDLPEDQWVKVDCGEDDGDTFSRYNLDAIEQSLHLQGKDEFVDRSIDYEKEVDRRTSMSIQTAVKPMEVELLDIKIITFVKSNPVLWRKSMDPEADKIDEETRRTVWKQLQRNLTNVTLEQIKDRWQHLYEMYKTFRLKTIKSIEDRSNLELKYSKYLAKLYFLYKIDEDELRNENNGLFEDCFELEDDEDAEHDTEEQDSDEEPKKEEQPKLKDMTDDKEFLLQLVKLVRQYPAIWDTQHEDYNDIMIRDNYWQEIHKKLNNFKHKQASDDEDNEIEIVEPKTDLITLDSDDEEPAAPSPIKSQQQYPHIKSQLAYSSPIKIKQGTSPIPTQTTRSILKPPAPIASSAPQIEDNMDLMSMAQSFLASMLEVEIQEGPAFAAGAELSGPKKQPRKKLTNKPNPTLLKQKALMERERLEEIKRNDQKLKMKCSVELKKAEEEFPYAKEMLEARAKEKVETEEADEAEKKENDQEEEEEEVTTSTAADEKDESNAKVVSDNEAINSSTEEINTATLDNDTGEITTKFSFKIIEKTTEKSEIDKEDAETETSEKDESVEIIVEIADKSEEYIVPSEEDELKNVKDKDAEVKLDNADDILQSKECQDTVEDSVLENVVDNTNNSDTEEIKKINGLTNEDRVPEKMETDDESPPITTNNEAITIDEKEYPQIDIDMTLDLDANNSKSNDLELEADQKMELEADQKIELEADQKMELETDKKMELEADQKMEQEVLKPQKENSETISSKEVENVEQQPVNNKLKNGDECAKPTNENEVISPTMDMENSITPAKQKNYDKETTEDLPVSEEKINNKELPTLMEEKINNKELPTLMEEKINNKELPTLTEGIPNKEQETETPSTDFKETSPNNGNV